MAWHFSSSNNIRPWSSCFKGIVYLKMENLTTFTHPQASKIFWRTSWLWFSIFYWWKDSFHLKMLPNDLKGQNIRVAKKNKIFKNVQILTEIVSDLWIQHDFHSTDGLWSAEAARLFHSKQLVQARGVNFSLPGVLARPHRLLDLQRQGTVNTFIISYDIVSYQDITLHASDHQQA